ncbi:hypothetical protein ACXZ1K_18575 [Pedobacter sp. PWIIR3]
MNNTFNINRFGLLLKRQWLEFGKIYLVTLGVAFGVIATFYMVAIWPSFQEMPSNDIKLHFREPLFLIFGFLFISVIASNYFAHFGQKAKTVIDLLIPASTFEKFLAAVFFTAILTVVSYVAIFYLTDLGFITKLRATYSSIATSASYADARGKFTVVRDNYDYFFSVNKKNMYPQLLALPFFVTSLFLLGSIYFNKFHYIKTAISVMVFCAIWAYIVINSIELLTKNRHMQQDSYILQNFDRNQDFVFWTMATFIMALTCVFWSITYVRLREKEV